ncbi:MAG: hypothetical protein WC551_10410 [Patescibacteria group bacterium]
MQKIRMLNRYGYFETVEWDYDPAKNPKAKRRAEETLKAKGIDGTIYEVAPEVFWFSTKEKEVNCSTYLK